MCCTKFPLIRNLKNKDKHIIVTFHQYWFRFTHTHTWRLIVCKMLWMHCMASGRAHTHGGSGCGCVPDSHITDHINMLATLNLISWFKIFDFVDSRPATLAAIFWYTDGEPTKLVAWTDFKPDQCGDKDYGDAAYIGNIRFQQEKGWTEPVVADACARRPRDQIPQSAGWFHEKGTWRGAALQSNKKGWCSWYDHQFWPADLPKACWSRSFNCDAAGSCRATDYWCGADAGSQGCEEKNEEEMGPAGVSQAEIATNDHCIEAIDITPWCWSHDGRAASCWGVQ